MFKLWIKKSSNEIIFRMDSDDIASPFASKNNLKSSKIVNNIAIIGSNIEEFNSVPHDLKRYRNVPCSSSEINNKKFYRNPLII